jgi:hypothetical protein
MTNNSLKAGSLRVEFFRAADRFAHRVSIVDGAGPEAILAESIEGSADEPWPASPALQECHREMGPDGRPRLLLVGMSGASHWSMSVETLGESSIAFDVACRGRGFPPRIGSAYRWPSPGSLSEGFIRSSVGGRACKLSMDPGTEGELRLEAHIARVECRVAPSESPQTVRWKHIFTIC